MCCQDAQCPCTALIVKQQCGLVLEGQGCTTPCGQSHSHAEEDPDTPLPCCWPPSQLNWRRGFSRDKKVSSEEFVLSAIGISIKMTQK